jgi:hypothetical protein
MALFSPKVLTTPPSSIPMAHASPLRNPTTIPPLFLRPLYRLDLPSGAPRRFSLLASGGVLQRLARHPRQLLSNPTPQPSYLGQVVSPSALLLLQRREPQQLQSW